ncbi:hypothetical protein KJ903_04380 [Patescibacteria group bacterium]|nr:hypothetical protein [Patescibacteria group bacterium]
MRSRRWFLEAAAKTGAGLIFAGFLPACQGGREIVVPTYCAQGTVLELMRQSGLILWVDERSYLDISTGKACWGTYFRQVEYLKNPVFWLRRRSGSHDVSFEGDPRDASQVQVLPGHDIVWAEI